MTGTSHTSHTSGPSPDREPAAASSAVGPVGVIGLGIMGSRLALGIVGREDNADTDVRVLDNDPEAVARATEQGLRAAADLRELVEHCPVIVLSLPTPSVVLRVVGDIADTARSSGRRPAPVVLDTSTVDPGTARRAAEVLAEAGGTYADTPILGRPGSVGAWTIPVGGPPEVLAIAERVLAPVSRAVLRAGDVGTASATKVLNNLMLGTINAVTAEVLVLAEAAGLDPGAFVDILVDSGAASVSPLFRDVAARAVEGDFDPTFSVRLMHKDNALAMAMADELGVPVFAGRAAHTLNTMAVASGLGDQDSIAVLKALEQITGLLARRHDSDASGQPAEHAG